MLHKILRNEKTGEDRGELSLEMGKTAGQRVTAKSLKIFHIAPG